MNQLTFEEIMTSKLPSFDDHNVDFSCGHPFIDIPEKSLKEFHTGIKEHPHYPFIVRNISHLFPDKDAILDALCLEPKVTLVDNAGKREGCVETKELVEEYRKDQLQRKLLDSFLGDHNNLIPKETFPIDLKICTTFILSPAKSVSPFHDDPSLGSNWMYLSEGKKVWWFILPKDVQYIQNTLKGFQIYSLATYTYKKLIDFLDGYLKGKMMIGTLNAGDFLYFPEETLHQVITHEKAVGFGGYIRPLDWKSVEK